MGAFRPEQQADLIVLDPPHAVGSIGRADSGGQRSRRLDQSQIDMDGSFSSLRQRARQHQNEPALARRIQTVQLSQDFTRRPVSPNEKSANRFGSQIRRQRQLNLDRQVKTSDLLSPNQ